MERVLIAIVVLIAGVIMFFVWDANKACTESGGVLASTVSGRECVKAK